MAHWLMFFVVEHMLNVHTIVAVRMMIQLMQLLALLLSVILMHCQTSTLYCLHGTARYCTVLYRQPLAIFLVAWCAVCQAAPNAL